MAKEKRTKPRAAAKRTPRTLPGQLRRATPALRLPRQSAPVARGRSVARFRLDVAAAQQNCDQCFSYCARLPRPMRAVCENLCRTACNG